MLSMNTRTTTLKKQTELNEKEVEELLHLLVSTPPERVTRGKETALFTWGEVVVVFYFGKSQEVSPIGHAYLELQYNDAHYKIELHAEMRGEQVKKISVLHKVRY